MNGSISFKPQKLLSSWETNVKFFAFGCLVEKKEASSPWRTGWISNALCF